MRAAISFLIHQLFVDFEKKGAIIFILPESFRERYSIQLYTFSCPLSKANRFLSSFLNPVASSSLTQVSKIHTRTRIFYIIDIFV